VRDVTVVTVTKELTNGLITTLKSVQNQKTPVSHLVIDGSENSRLKEYVSQNFSNVKVLGQTPNGIYSAMNYGVSMVPDNTNVIFLNSNDFLVGTNQLGNLNDQACRSETWAYGGVVAFLPKSSFSKNLGLQNFAEKNFERGNLLIPHPSTIVQASWIKKLGGFNEKFTIVADLEIAFRMYKHFGPPAHYNDIVSAHELGGVSTTNLTLQTKELRKARILNFPKTSFAAMSKKLFKDSRVEPSFEKNEILDLRRKQLHIDICDMSTSFPNCCRLKYLENVII
jgi:GT2 family glycosyltransferase